MIGAVVTLLVIAAIVVFPGFGRRQTSVLDVYGKPSYFFGLRKIYEDLQDPKKEARVLMVHGMGASKTHSYEALSHSIARQLDFETEGVVPEVHELSWSSPLPSKSEPAKLFVRTYRKGDRTLRTYDVLWAPLIFDIKRLRLAEEEEKLRKERAWANGKLKQEMMNTRLTDPVIYLGTMQLIIRSAVKQAVCHMINGTWEFKAGGEECMNPHLGDAGVAVISESLGSFIALEAINDLENVPDKKTQKHFKLPIHGFYMLANQLPLLHLARLEKDPMAAFLDKRSGPPRGAMGFTMDVIMSFMEVVTISDPDDILSYPISASFATEYPNARFVNVRTPIGKRYVAGLINHPVKAHAGHESSPKVMEMLTNGAPDRDAVMKAAEEALDKLPSS